jgi:hypothetical protein
MPISVADTLCRPLAAVPYFSLLAVIVTLRQFLCSLDLTEATAVFRRQDGYQVARLI